MSILLQLQPDNINYAWLIGILCSTIAALAGFVVYLLRNNIPRDVYENNKKALDSSVPTQAYDQLLSFLREYEEKCAKCELINGETLRDIYQLLGSINKTLEMEIQSSLAIKHLLELLLWGDKQQK